MQLIVITDNDLLPNETAIINELFSLGLKRLHIRKNGFTAQELSVYIKQIHPEYHNKLVICTHFELLNQYQLGGIHLNSHQRYDAAAWKIITNSQPLSVSTSFHSWEEITNANYEYKYAFISPVFDSISKAGYKAAIELDGATIIKDKMRQSGIQCPGIYGLGGVDHNNLKILHNQGFDGAAVLGAIWRHNDPIEAFLVVNNVINSLSDV